MKIKEQIPRLLALFMYVVGLFNVAANVLRPFKHTARRLDSYTLLFVNSTAFSTSLISGLLLITLARGIRKRKRRAWSITVMVFAIGIAAEAFRYRGHFDHVMLDLIGLLLLIIFRDEFYAKSDPNTKNHPFYGLFFGFFTFVILGTLLLLFRHNNAIVGNPTFFEILKTVLNGLVGIAGPITFNSDRVTDTVHVTLLIFGIAILNIPIWLYFRKITPSNQISKAEASEIKSIVLKNAQSDSLSYFATRLDKAVMWSDSHTAGQTYRVQNGVLLVSGDPFGHYSLWSEVIDKIIRLSKEYAWTLAVMGCGERAGELWIEKTGMVALHIGDEAIIASSEFTLEGSNMKNVREMINKTKRLGYVVEVAKFSELDGNLRKTLKEKSTEWRYGERERGFSMALDRFLDEIDDQEIYLLAKKDNELLALMTFAPWGQKGISLDRMLRSKDANTGVNELIIATTVEFARANKIEKISLNFAAFRSIFEEAERISAGPVLRLKRNFLRFIAKWVQVESLYRFNAKFQPDWNPRYLIYPGQSKLIEIVYAVGRAEGFI